MERPSIALAQAFQFELKFGQGEVIGEWVPQSEPGASDVMNDDEKWLRGIRWSEIDARLILRHTVLTRNGEKEIEVDLKRMPMVMEELSKLGKRPASGPVVICEWSGIPWTSHEFRRWWRKVADACGIPKTVYNMDSRERRTGADTAASDDDISDEGRPGSSNDHARRLIEKIRALLRQLSPEQEQGDVIHDIALDIHSGKISEADICPKLCRRYVTKQWKAAAKERNHDTVERASVVRVPALLIGVTGMQDGGACARGTVLILRANSGEVDGLARAIDGDHFAETSLGPLRWIVAPDLQTLRQHSGLYGDGGNDKCS